MQQQMATVLLAVASAGVLFLLANFGGLAGSLPPLLSVLGLLAFPVASGALTIWGLRVVRNADISEAEKEGWKDFIFLAFGVGGYLAIREFLPQQKQRGPTIQVSSGVSRGSHGQRETARPHLRPYKMNLLFAFLLIWVWCGGVGMLLAGLFGFVDSAIFNHIVPGVVGAAIVSGTWLMVGGFKTLKTLPLSEAERQRWRSWLIVGGVFAAFVLIFKSRSRGGVE
jgi:hypothetical protein